VTQVGSERRAHLGACAWFWVWAVVGGCVTIGFVSALGLFFVPVIALGAFVGVSWGRAFMAMAPLGAITGAGLPFLLVAYLQRKGPGTVC